MDKPYSWSLWSQGGPAVAREPRADTFWGMEDTTRTGAPAPLVVAASLAAVEGLVLVMLGVLELASWDADRAAMNVTTTAFFLGFGAVLLWCAWALHRGQSWARAPIVMFQLIQLGVAWSFRGDPTTLVAVALAVVAVVVVAGVLHPDSIEHLADEPR